MKIQFYLILLLICAGNVFTSKAQQVVALHQSGDTRFFSGTDAFRLAYDAANSGDTIYLSGGSFTAPDTIAKTITVFGAGHFPEFTGPTGQTLLSGHVILAEGAENTYLEGLHLTERLIFARDHRVDDVVVRRCRIDGQVLLEKSGTGTNYSNNTLLTECTLTYGSGHSFHNSRNLTLTNSIVFGASMGVLSYATITNSLFFYPASSVGMFYIGDYTVVKNCVIANNKLFSSTNNFSFLNNVLFNVETAPNFYNNTGSNNHYGVTRENFFVEQEDKIFDYTHDYHLQSPESFLGTDGTQVGIYGGMHPWKEGSVPMIPHIISKSISHSVDAEGNLKVEINVSAQEY
jgi:hypothetical protein